jgi:hypothetical protein
MGCALDSDRSGQGKLAESREYDNEGLTSLTLRATIIYSISTHFHGVGNDLSDLCQYETSS